VKNNLFTACILATALLLCFSSYAWVEEKELIIADFSKGVDSFGIPVDWEIVKKVGSPSLDIKQENNEFFLHLISEKTSFGLKKNISIDIKKYPYITFAWRVEKLPENADFRNKETDDQAAQLYIVFGKFQLFANIIGYIWGNKAPRFTTGISPAWNRTRIIVLQSGSEKLGTWVTETRNIHEDYKTLFGKDPGKANLITLYINSQHTKSRAESYFGKIYFSKNGKPECPLIDEKNQTE
jgi:hypothetical protein